jgi:hypothetical protein
MRQKFSTELELVEPITFTRGPERITFEVRPWPAGYGPWLRSVFPPPIRFRDGKPEPDAAKLPEYRDLVGFLVLAKCLETQGLLETALPTGRGGRSAWEAAAVAVRQEFRDAGVTEGEIRALMAAAERVSGDPAARKARLAEREQLSGN